MSINGGVDDYAGPGTYEEEMSFTYAEMQDPPAELTREFSTFLGGTESTITIDPSGSGTFTAERLSDESGASISITGRWSCRD